MPQLLNCRDVRLRYQPGTARIGPFDAQLGPGDRVGLSGASGSGKTTILDWIAGIAPNTLHSSNLAPGIRDPAARVGYISQDASDSLSPYLTAIEQVSAAGPDARDCLCKVGLNDGGKQGSYPCQLSGGERKRVQVAQALAMRPDLILADEPTANLDSENSETVLRALDESGSALLVASHREAVFERLRCSPVVRLTPQPQFLTWPDLPAPGPSLAEAEGLSKTFAKRDFWMRRIPRNSALRDVSLQIRESEVIVLTGPSGSGKTTLARILARLDPADAGSLHGNRAVQLVPQEPSSSLNPRQKLHDAIREANPAADTAAVLESVGLRADWLHRPAAELSEGQRARVAVARAIEALRGGGLLILDESLSGLDARTCHQVFCSIAAVQRQNGLACLIIAHEAPFPAHRTLRMREGRLQ